MPPTALTATASGSHTRVQLQPIGIAITPHGTLNTFDPKTGAFTAFMDFQPAGEAAYQFTPTIGVTDPTHSHFTDQNGQVWKLVG